MYNIISPNMLKTYLTCPKKYYYKYINNFNIPSSITYFEKGKKIHALANYYLQKIDISRIEGELNYEEQLAWQKLLSNPYYNKKCYNSEFQLSCKVGKYWVGGRLDAVVYDDDCYYILDYKTGSTPKDAQYDVQTMIYLLCLDKHLKGNYKNLKFVYINLKKDENVVLNFDEQIKTKYEKLLTEILDKITKDNFDVADEISTEDITCQNCEYNKVCKL